MKLFRIITLSLCLSLCVSAPLSYGMDPSFTTKHVVVLPDEYKDPNALIEKIQTAGNTLVAQTSTETANLITQTSTETAARIAQTSSETATRIDQINAASSKLLDQAHACAGLQQKTFFENATYAGGALLSGGLGFVFVGLGLRDLLDAEKNKKTDKDPVFNYFHENVFYSSAKILVGAACILGAGYLLGNIKAAPALVSAMQ